MVTGEYTIPEVRQTAGRDIGGFQPPDGARPGQILWLLGLTRLQTQMRVIRAFQSTIQESHPSSLTASTGDRIRQSYRRRRLERENKQRSYQLRAGGPVFTQNAERSKSTPEFQ